MKMAIIFPSNDVKHKPRLLSLPATAAFRVARWYIYIFKTKIPIGVNFRGPWNGKGRIIIWPFGINMSQIFCAFYGNLVYVFPPVGILCQEKSGNPGRIHSFALFHILHPML
jgi:hypothetical protein